MLFAFCTRRQSHDVHSRGKAAGGGSRTQSRVEHIQRHLVALGGPGDGHEPLVAVVLRFVDLDHAAAELTDLVDLRTTFADDRTHHVVRDEDLLRQRLTGDHALHRLGRRTGVAGIRGMSDLWRLMGSRAGITRCLCVSGKMDGSLRLRLAGLPMHVRRAVSRGRVALCLVILSPIMVGMTVVSSHGLRHVRDDLHPTRNHPGRASAARSVSRCCRSTKSFRQLFHQGLSHIIAGNVDSICDAENNQ